MLQLNRLGEVIQFKMSTEMGGRPLYWVAAYLVGGVLIDSGCKHTSEEFIKAIDGRRVDLAVNTHHHEDHVGANSLLAAKYGIQFFAHPLEVPLIKKVPRLNPYQEMVWGYPDPAEALPLDINVSTGSLNFKIVHTPGHCAGHVALVESDRGWCFSGDLFVSESQKVLRADEDINGIISSAKTLLSLDIPNMKLFTSIGRVVENGRAALGEFVSNMESIRDRALRLHQSGYTAAEIRDEIFGKESSLCNLTGGHYSVENLILSLLKKPP